MPLHRPSCATTALRVAIAAALVAGLAACMPSGCDAPGGPTYAVVPAQAPSPDCDPPPPCRGCGGASGDPHLETFDGRRYDLQTAAEVVAVRDPDSTFEVQWRQEPYGSTRTAGITAAAMRLGGTRVTVAGDDPVVRVDGDEVELSPDDTLVLSTGVALHLLDGQVIVVHEASGASVHLQPDDRAMGVLVDPPDGAEGNLEGLLGDADGDSSNDVVLADGTALADPTWDDVHPELAEAWRVTGDSTLFDYDDGAGPDTYWDPTFPERQVRLDDFSDEEQAEAEAVCRAAGVSDPGLLEDCIFDVLVTGDPSVAELFARQQLARGEALEPDDGAAGDGGNDDDDETMDLDVDAFEWVGLVPDTNNVSGVWAAGDVALVQAGHRELGADVLAGVSLDDGEMLWQVEGIDRHSDVGVADGLVVAYADGDGPHGGPDDRPALVGIDLDSGEVVARHDPDRDADEAGIGRSGVFATVGDTVVHVSRHQMIALDAESLELRWEARLPGTIDAGPAPAVGVDGDRLWVAWRASDVLGVGLVDPADGTLVAEVEAPERLGRAFDGAATDGGSFVLSAYAGGTGALVRVDADRSGSEVEIAWIEELGEEDRPPPHVATAGGLLVGYTGSTLSGFAVADGERLWDVDPTSFNNNDRQVVIDDRGRSYIGSFGGAFFESYRPDGEVNWILEPEDVTVSGAGISVSVVGPTVDGLVLAATATVEGIAVVAVPTGKG